MLTFLLIAGFTTLVGTAVIELFKLAVMSIGWVVDWLRNKMKNKKPGTIGITNDMDLFLKKAIEEAKAAGDVINVSGHKIDVKDYQKQVDKLKQSLKGNTHMVGTFNTETGKLEDCEFVKPEKIEQQLNNAINGSRNGLVILENVV